MYVHAYMHELYKYVTPRMNEEFHAHEWVKPLIESVDICILWGSKGGSGGKEG